MSIKLLDIIWKIRYLLNRSLLARTAIRLVVRAVFFALSPPAAKAASVAGFGGTLRLRSGQGSEAVPFQSGSHAEGVLTKRFTCRSPAGYKAIYPLKQCRFQMISKRFMIPLNQRVAS
jgi:hypothetical protein